MVVTVFLQRPEELVEQADGLIVEATKSPADVTGPLRALLLGLSGIQYSLDMAEIESMSAIQVFDDLKYLVTRSRDVYVVAIVALVETTTIRQPILKARDLLDSIGRHGYMRQAVDRASSLGHSTQEDTSALGDSLTAITRQFEEYTAAITTVIDEQQRRS